MKLSFLNHFFVSVITPVVVQALANRGVFRRYPSANAPIQMGLVGFILIFATPLGCAFFSQMATIKVTFDEKLDFFSLPIFFHSKNLIL